MAESLDIAMLTSLALARFTFTSCIPSGFQAQLAAVALQFCHSCKLNLRAEKRFILDVGRTEEPDYTTELP